MSFSTLNIFKFTIAKYIYGVIYTYIYIYMCVCVILTTAGGQSGPRPQITMPHMWQQCTPWMPRVCSPSMQRVSPVSDAKAGLIRLLVLSGQGRRPPHHPPCHSGRDPRPSDQRWPGLCDLREALDAQGCMPSFQRPEPPLPEAAPGLHRASKRGQLLMSLIAVPMSPLASR